MRKILFIFSIILLFATCNDDPTKILLKAELLSETEYLIVCKGYPKKGLTSKVQKISTAKEAALINAQYFAGEKLKNIDPTSGEIRSFEYHDTFGVIYYVIQKENIKEYIK